MSSRDSKVAAWLERNWITPGDAAKLATEVAGYPVGASNIYYHCYAGHLPYYKPAGRIYLNREDVISFWKDRPPYKGAGPHSEGEE